MNLLGLSISNKLVKIWSKLLAYPAAPYFLTDALAVQIPGLHLTHNEFSATIKDLSFHDSYTTYNVGSEAGWVALFSSQELQKLPNEVRLELLQLQAKLGRGQIYTFADYKECLQEDELERVYKQVFEYEGQTMLELIHDLWHSFSFETQKHWLTKFISEDRSDCLSGTLSKKAWKQINKHYPAVKYLVGFSDRSGPNCFATTLAAVQGVEEAKKISGLWLQHETFLREVQKRGYRKMTLDTSDLPQDSMLVWENNNGIQHACFYLGDGLVLNKDAQTWFAPRQILKVETVLESWKEFQVSVYVKG